MSIAARRMRPIGPMSAGHPDMRASSTASLRHRASPRAAARADDRTPLAQSLGRRVEALAGHLQAALDGDEHAIHQARVATRRLREIVPIVIDTRSRRGERLRRAPEAPDRARSARCASWTSP